MKNIFAENLVNLRKRSKMTQEKLAARLGVSFQSVSKWENAQGYPDIELIPVIGNYSALSKKSPKNCRNFLMLFKKLSTRQGLSCFVSQ